MDKFITIGIVIAFIVGFFAIYAFSLKSNLVLDYKIQNVDISNIIRKKLSISLDLFATNKSASGINIKNVYFEVYYAGKLVAKTPQANNDLRIVPNAIKYPALKNLNVDLFINDASADLIAKYISKKPIELQIKMKSTVYLIPISFKTSMVYDDYIGKTESAGPVHFGVSQ